MSRSSQPARPVSDEPVAEPGDVDERAHTPALPARQAAVTPVGVYVGEHTLAAVAPAHAAPDEAFVVDGEPVQRSFDHLQAATLTLENAPVDCPEAHTALTAAFWVRLRAQLHHAAAQVTKYAQQFAGAVLVLEDLTQPPRPLYHHRDVVGELGAWTIPVLRNALVEKATEHGLPVAWVEPDYTSQECHRCGEHGERHGQTLRCTNGACPVGEVDADRSAAVSIAQRGVADDLR